MTRPRLTLLFIIAAVIAGVYSLDVVLERVEAAEVHNEAQHLYTQGTKLLAASEAAQALDVLQRAHAMERGNRQYQLAYAEALTGATRYPQAADLLTDIVQRAPNDARANLLLARLARAQKDLPDEMAYYHRAIYGVWDRDSVIHANDARLEWIRELVARGDRRLLLGELLQLDAQTQDPAVLQQVAHYLVLAGAPNRAAEVYRTLLETHADDATLDAGLGQAEAALGQYGAAQRAYQRALRTHPDDAGIRHDMQLARALSEIDPTPRSLPSREKYDRSVSILKLVRDSVTACGSKAPELDEADRLLKLKHPDTSNEAAEEGLQLAETLWRGRPTDCPAPEVLPVLMQKLAQ
jgi:tetratricopeptide (TPR) repeat protein